MKRCTPSKLNVNVLEFQEEWVSKIRDIPHLCLLDNVPYEDMLVEAKAAMAQLETELVEYKFKDRSSPLRVAGVLDVRSDPAYAGQMVQAEETRHFDHEPTDLGVLMPKTVEFMESISDLDGRVKISYMLPKSRVRFHGHYDPTYVVHIPLQTHPDVKMVVRRNDLTPDSQQHYPVGTAWLFNSQHQHAVWNNSDEIRIHLWCNFAQMKQNVPNNRLNELVAAALAKL